MFVSLAKISEENSAAGELSRFLLGRKAATDDYAYGDIRKIAENFKKGFEVFKEDREATSMLTFAERKIIEGKIEGKIEVLHTELGLQAEEIADKLNIDVNHVKEVLEKLGLSRAA